MTRSPQFDVFLCHNSEDKPFIRDIAQRLRAQSLVPWLDEEQLLPGRDWLDILERDVERIKTVAVFVGKSGLGPWQRWEVSAFLREFVEREIPVIPVLLPNAPQQPQLPILLKNLSYVDFRRQEPEPFGFLVWGITGERSPVIPTSQPAPPPQPTPQAKPPEPVKPDRNRSEQWFSFEVVTVKGLESSGLLGLQKKLKLDRRSAKAQYFRENLGNGVTLDMVAILEGKFLMGSPESEETRIDVESPQHSVTIAPFYMGKYAVTQAQYQSIMGNNPADFKGDQRPVENVSWHDAIAFCQKLSEKTGKFYRLPSEAEWEYACRAGITTPFYFGETITTELVNFNGNETYGSAPKGMYRKQTTDVGSFPPNGFGLYDMHGNVWEWCADHWHDNYQGAPIDGTAWTVGGDSGRRLLRGGSWSSIPRNCRSADRGRDFSVSYFRNIGFRVVWAAART
jgi:formylglycine-generating enzyme required for sulfatase activity